MRAKQPPRGPKEIKIGRTRLRTGIIAYIPQIPDYVQIRLKDVHEAMDDWTQSIVMPEVLSNCPIKNPAWDPRTQYHPSGAIKKSLYLRRRRGEGSPFTWLAVSIRDGAEREYIATQVLHRGWSLPYRGSPLYSSTPFVFRLKPGEEVRNPKAKAIPPPGATGENWVKTGKVVQTEQITRNPWIVAAYYHNWIIFQDKANRTLGRPGIRIDYQKLEMLKSRKIVSFSGKRARYYKR